MTPLGRTALGLLLVLLDLRLGGFDALPDVAGWVLVVVGLGELAPRWPGFWTVRRAAVVAGVLSLADLVHPTRTTSTATGSTSGVVPPEGLLGLLSVGASAAAVVVAVLLSLRLRDLARESGDDHRARTFGRFAGYHAVVGGALVLTSLVGLATTSGRGPVEAEGASAVALVALVLTVLLVEVLFVLTLRAARLEPWALPGPAAAPADERV